MRISIAGWTDLTPRISEAKRSSSNMREMGRIGMEGTSRGLGRGPLQVKDGMKKPQRLEGLQPGAVERMVDGGIMDGTMLDVEMYPTVPLSRSREIRKYLPLWK